VLRAALRGGAGEGRGCVVLLGIRRLQQMLLVGRRSALFHYKLCRPQLHDPAIMRDALGLALHQFITATDHLCLAAARAPGRILVLRKSQCNQCEHTGSSVPYRRAGEAEERRCMRPRSSGANGVRCPLRRLGGR
jgi:hypothetical protein